MNLHFRHFVFGRVVDGLEPERLHENLKIDWGFSRHDIADDGAEDECAYGGEKAPGCVVHHVCDRYNSTKYLSFNAED